MSVIRHLCIAAALAGCSDGGPNPPLTPNRTAPEMRVVNHLSEPLVFFAVAADLAPLLDPVPEASVEEPWATPLPPGRERVLDDIQGQEEAPNGGVALYLYALTPDLRRAEFVRVQLASGDAIRRDGGRIVVRRLRN